MAMTYCTQNIVNAVNGTNLASKTSPTLPYMIDMTDDKVDCAHGLQSFMMQLWNIVNGSVVRIPRQIKDPAIYMETFEIIPTPYFRELTIQISIDYFDDQVIIYGIRPNCHTFAYSPGSESLVAGSGIVTLENDLAPEWTIIALENHLFAKWTEALELHEIGPLSWYDYYSSQMPQGDLQKAGRFRGGGPTWERGIDLHALLNNLFRNGGSESVHIPLPQDDEAAAKAKIMNFLTKDGAKTVSTEQVETAWDEVAFITDALFAGCDDLGPLVVKDATSGLVSVADVSTFDQAAILKLADGAIDPSRAKKGIFFQFAEEKGSVKNMMGQSELPSPTPTTTDYLLDTNKQAGELKGKAFVVRLKEPLTLNLDDKKLFEFFAMLIKYVPDMFDGNPDYEEFKAAKAAQAARVASSLLALEVAKHQDALAQIQIQSLKAEEEHARNQKALADEVALKERSVTMQKSQNMDQALQMLQDFMNSPQHQGGNPSTPGSTSRNLMADATINLTQTAPSSSNVRNLDSVVRFVPHFSKPDSSDYYHTTVEIPWPVQNWMARQNLPAEYACTALINALAKPYLTRVSMLAQEAWDEAVARRDSPEETLRCVFRTIRRALWGRSTQLLEAGDENFLANMEALSNEAPGGVVARIKTFAKIMEASWSTDDMRNMKISIEDAALANAFEMVVRKAAAKTSTATAQSWLPIVQSMEIDKGRFTWEVIKGMYTNTPAVFDMGYGADGPSPGTNLEPPTPENDPIPQMQVQGGAIMQSQAGSGSGSEQQTSSIMASNISDDVSSKLAPTFQKLEKNLVGPLERITATLVQINETMTAQSQGQTEVLSALKILRQVITTLRDDPDSFTNQSATLLANAATAQAAQILNSQANSSYGTPRGRPSFSNSGQRRPAFGFADRLSKASKAAEQVAKREPVDLTQLPDPWIKLVDALLKLANKEYSDLNHDCVLCPNPQYPHPTSKCGLLFLLSPAGQKWLRKKAESQQAMVEASHGHTDAELMACMQQFVDSKEVPSFILAVMQGHKENWEGENGGHMFSTVIQQVQMAYSDGDPTAEILAQLCVEDPS